MSSLAALLDRYFWSRHANPRSVWLLVALYPLLVLAIYRRQRSLLAGAVLLAGTGIVAFPPPEDDSAWATSVVRGERAWVEAGLLSSPGDLLLVVGAAPLYLFTLRAAARRQPLRTLLGTAVSLPLMFVFFHRMAQLADTGED